MDIKEYEAVEEQRIQRNLEYMNEGVRFIDIRTAYIDEALR